MSRINDLIRSLCPNGVEYKPVGQFSECRAGATPASGVPAYWEGGTIPWMSSGEVNKGTVDSTDRMITQAAYDSCSTRMVPANAVVIALAGQGKTRGTVARTRIPLCTNQSLCSIICDESVNSDFLYHYLRTQYQRLRDVSSGDDTRGGLNLKVIRRFRVPVPPVEVQRAIVRVLDLFSTLEATLEAELEARRVQYAYYRDDLFSFRDASGVQWVPMGEVGEFIRGRRFTKNDIVDDGIPSIHYGEIYTTYGVAASEVVSHVRDAMHAQLRYAKPGDVVIAAVGETVEDVGLGVAWLGATDVAIHDDCFLYRSAVLNPKFVSYYLRTAPYIREKAKYVARAKVKRMSGVGLAKVSIPVPSLEKQERIVRILDRFDALVSDVRVGLPAELRARRRQYEYYRVRLLSFEELSA